MNSLPKWVVASKSLGFSTGQILFVSEQNDYEITSKVECLSDEIIAFEITNKIELLNEVIFQLQPNNKLLLKVPRKFLKKSIRMCCKENCGAPIIYGVFTDYYTYHIPIEDKKVKIVMKYCLGLRSSCGWKRNFKRAIKHFFISIGASIILFDYFIIYKE